MITIHITDVYCDKGHITSMFILRKQERFNCFIWGSCGKDFPHRGKALYEKVGNYKYLQVFIQVPSTVHW